MKLNIKGAISCAVLATTLSACGLFGDRAPEYYGVQEPKALQVPEHLDTPSSSTALTIDREPVALPEQPLETVPPRIITNASDKDSNTRMRWSADGIYILVEDSAESVQRRLAYVIERSGMRLRDPSPDGNYRFEYRHQPGGQDEGFFSKLAFWRDDGPDYSGAYQALPESDGDKTRVYLKYADGGEVPMDVAEHVLGILKDRLG